MTTETARGVRERPIDGNGSVHALVAVGSSPGSRPTIEGELVWIPLPCGKRNCSCRGAFAGIASKGLTAVAQVRLLRDVSRRDVRRALAAGMCRHCVPDAAAPSHAAALLNVAEALPDGTLVRRDDSGRIVPFPPGSTVWPDGRVSSPRSER